MFQLILALSAVGLLVGKAIMKAAGPSTKPLDERYKLERLKLRKVITLDEAEDGLVLARRYNDKGAMVRFQIEISKLKKKRMPI